MEKLDLVLGLSEEGATEVGSWEAADFKILELERGFSRSYNRKALQYTAWCSVSKKKS